MTMIMITRGCSAGSAHESEPEREYDEVKERQRLRNLYCMIFRTSNLIRIKLFRNLDYPTQSNPTQSCDCITQKETDKKANKEENEREEREQGNARERDEDDETHPLFAHWVVDEEAQRQLSTLTPHDLIR